MAYSGRRPAGLLIESENSDIFQVIEEIDTVRLIPILLTLFLTGPVMADDWKEYENQDYSFTIHFPVDPTVETATYQAADERLISCAAIGIAQLGRLDRAFAGPLLGPEAAYPQSHS